MFLSPSRRVFQIMCRCATPLDNAVKEKISMFCHVEPTQVKPPPLLYKKILFSISTAGRYEPNPDLYLLPPDCTSETKRFPMFSPQVICVHDVSSIYRVPLLLEDQGVVGFFYKRLDLPIEMRARKMLTKWKEMSDR